MINWFTWISVLVVFLFTIFIIQHYASKITPVYVYVFVFLGYFSAFVLIVLIPYDIFLSLSKESQDVRERKEFLNVLWHLVYWSVFCLCW
jgi:hypothetical protein